MLRLVSKLNHTPNADSITDNLATYIYNNKITFVNNDLLVLPDFYIDETNAYGAYNNLWCKFVVHTTEPYAEFTIYGTYKLNKKIKENTIILQFYQKRAKRGYCYVLVEIEDHLRAINYSFNSGLIAASRPAITRY